MRIIVRISDGLGNQLFEYSLGKYLSDRLGCEMYFDRSHFIVSSSRTFQLDKFAAPSKVPRWGKLKEWAFLLLWASKAKLGERLFRKTLPFLGLTWIPVKDPFMLQADFEDAAFASRKGTIYISGCYGHLPHMPERNALREQLSLIDSPSDSNQNYIGAMRNCDSVSVHVRRTDYLFAANNSPALKASYQRRAMEVIRQKVASPRWFIFSDDMEWCRKEFADLEGAVFVSGNEAEPWEDIRLMAACRHHVIANSSFSWWDAFLGDSCGVTIYPKPWFKGLEMPSSGVPSDWIAVSSK